MQIVSWNARQKFREKINLFSPDTIDVLVVQECENTELAAASYLHSGWRYLWVGGNKHKGLGVFVPLTSTVTELEWNTQDSRYFLPVAIKDELMVVGVWAMGGKTKRDSYAGQITRFLDQCSERIKPESTLLVGDFNSNAYWDKRHKVANHTKNNQRLNELGLTSIYHHQEVVKQGDEHDATFYMYGHRDKPYHIDFAYLPKRMVNKASIKIGHPKEWLQYSDHMPLYIQTSTND